MAQENSALIRRWFEEVWNNGRMETIDEMASPDVVGHGQAQHDTVIGRDQFRVFVAEFRRAFPDLRVKIDHIVEQGDKAAARWTATMTHQGDFLGFAP
ncbi:MAG: ester cyclase, partial [Terriglobales bacterium]